MMSATSEESTTTPKESGSKSRRISSSAKKTPAIGALKVAEMPPAAPQATRSRIRDSGSRSDLAQGRAERRADLHDRPFAADRAARADAEGRGQRLDDGHLRPDPAAALGDGQHHLRHAMPARFTREEIDQRAVEQAADDRHQHNEPQAKSGDERFGACPAAL